MLNTASNLLDVHALEQDRRAFKEELIDLYQCIAPVIERYRLSARKKILYCMLKAFSLKR